MTQDIMNQLKKVKSSSARLALLNSNQCTLVLRSLSKKLRESYQVILDKNAKDLACLPKEDPMYDRLLLTKDKIDTITNDVESLTALPSPLGEKKEVKVMENGLRIEKVVVPIGVVAVIYESRPNVTIDVFALCFKTANACILKGGKEAHHSNQILVKIIQEVLAEHNIDPNILYLLPPGRKSTQAVLNAVGLVDVCIPRGSQSLINFVRENAKIPVIETGAGIVHAYFDESGNIEKGRLIINNAKTRRVSVCNALDTLIIHKNCLDSLYELVEPLIAYNVEIFADDDSYKALTSKYRKELLHIAGPEDFGKEFLSYKLSIKTVSSLEQATQHIMMHTSGHSEVIIAEDQGAISYFLERIDAAAVYVNASTAFTDGGQFGMGAEIGISTQKLHARGPMGLEALTSYKWIIYGDGHIRP